MQGGSPTDSELLTGSTVRRNADPSYLYLHHNTMQANWHQYIECTNPRRCYIGKLPSSVQYACSRSDCTAVDYGGSCNKLDGDENVSYAFNMYFQMNGQDVESCVFDGLAQIVEKSASVDNCLFPIGLESVGVRIGLDAILNILVGFFLFLTLL
ncbi:hypothetical protein KY285_020739 [Solanum tuberosum]|nr:hypothetical protein KY285_020739 [Solanum tuberosum]